MRRTCPAQRRETVGELELERRVRAVRAMRKRAANAQNRGETKRGAVQYKRNENAKRNATKEIKVSRILRNEAENATQTALRQLCYKTSKRTRQNLVNQRPPTYKRTQRKRNKTQTVHPSGNKRAKKRNQRELNVCL